MIDSNLNKSTATNYILAFPKLPTEKDLSYNRPFILNIFGTVIPSVSLTQIESRWQGGKMNFQSGEMTWDTWPINFIVDSKLENWLLMFHWLTWVHNNSDQYTRTPQAYQVDAMLGIMDNWEVPLLRIKFVNVWIQSLGEVTLSQREGEAIVESSATLYYDRYELQSP